MNDAAESYWAALAALRPRALSKMGWIVSMGKVEPAQKHNHMPSVTLWRSLIFGRKPEEPQQFYQPSLFGKT